MKYYKIIFILICISLVYSGGISTKGRRDITSTTILYGGIDDTDSLHIISEDTLNAYNAAQISDSLSNYITCTEVGSQISDSLTSQEYFKVSNDSSTTYPWTFGNTNSSPDYHFTAGGANALTIDWDTFDISTYNDITAGNDIIATGNVSGAEVYEEYGENRHNVQEYHDEWVRFAQAPILSSMNYGLFELQWNGDYIPEEPELYERQNGAIMFTATADLDSIGQVQINILHSSCRERTYIGVPYIRAVTKNGEEDSICYLEYYAGTNDESSTKVWLHASQGWNLLNPFIAGSVPTGYDSLTVSTTNQWSLNNVNGSTTIDRDHNLDIDGHVHADFDGAKFYRDSSFTFTSANTWETIPLKDIHGDINSYHYSYNADSSGIVIERSMVLQILGHFVDRWTGPNIAAEIRFRVVKGRNGSTRVYSRCGQAVNNLVKLSGDIHTTSVSSMMGFADNDTIFIQGQVTNTNLILAPDYKFDNATTGSMQIVNLGEY